MNAFSQNLVTALFSALEDKKALDPQVIELGENSALADAFIIASGNSDVHMQTLLRSAYEALTARGVAVRVEGEHSTQWILIDAGDLVIHIFSVKAREYYNLERILEALKHKNAE